MKELKTLKKHHKRLVKWLAWTGGLVLLGVGLLEVTRQVAQEKLPVWLNARIAQESKQQYSLSIAQLKLGFLGRAVTCYGLHIMPDTAYRARTIDSASSAWTEVSIQQIHIKGFNWWKWLLSKSVQIGEIDVNQVRLVYHTVDERSAKKQSFMQHLKATVKQIEIGEWSIQGVSYQVWKGADLNTKDFPAPEIQLEGKGLLFDVDRQSRWSIADLEVRGKHLLFDPENSLYVFRAADLSYSLKDQKMKVDSFVIYPKYSEKEWPHQVAFKRDRYDLSFPEIRVRGIEAGTWMRSGRLLVEEVLVKRANMQIYSDKNMKTKISRAADNFPSLVLQRLKLPLTIRKINLREMNIYYKEQNPASGRAGLVFFEHLNGTLAGFSNDSVQIRHEPWIRAHFSTRFLGKPSLKLDMAFDMRDSLGGFTYRGVLTAAPAPFYNQLLEPLMLARAEKGQVQAVRFQVKANRYGADVRTALIYEGLQVAALRVDDGVLSKKRVMSFFVNWLAIKKSNPDTGEASPRIAHLYYQHPQEKTFFNLLWKAIYQGFQVNLGL